MGVKSDATFKSSLKYTTMPKKNQEKTAELQRRLQFNENGIDYGVSSVGFKIILYIPCGPAMMEQPVSHLGFSNFPQK